MPRECKNYYTIQIEVNMYSMYILLQPDAVCMCVRACVRVCDHSTEIDQVFIRCTGGGSSSLQNTSTSSSIHTVHLIVCMLYKEQVYTTSLCTYMYRICNPYDLYCTHCMV